MADIHKFSERVIDFGERLSNVADAAQGKRMERRSSWVLLPAAGAGLYALARSEFFARQAKGVVDEAKTRASELPNDLMKSVRQTTQTTQTTQKSPSRTTSRSGGQRRRQNSSTRKTKSGG